MFNFRLAEVSLPTESVAGRLRTVPYSFASIKGNIQEETKNNNGYFFKNELSLIIYTTQGQT